MKDNKFNVILQRKDDLFLKSRIFYEKIPKEDLKLQVGNLKEMDYKTKGDNNIFYNKLKSKNINNNHELMQEYLSKNKNGFNSIKFENILNGCWGRLCFDSIFWVQFKTGDLRRKFISNYYYNFDLCSSHLFLLKESCIRIGINCPVINYLIDNKNNFRKKIYKYFELEDNINKETVCKDIIYTNLYIEEDKYNEIYVKHNLNKNKPFPKILIDLKNEVDKIKTELIKINPELWEYCKNNFHKVNGKINNVFDNDFGRNNVKGYFLALYLQEQENRLVSCVLEWLYFKTNVLKSDGRNGVFIFEFDSIYLLKENIDKQFGNYNNFLEIINKKTKELVGIDIKWDCKIITDNIKIDDTISKKNFFLEKVKFYEYIPDEIEWELKGEDINEKISYNIDYENIIFFGILIIVIILIYLSKKYLI